MMVELEDYFREVILDHSRRPRQRGALEGYSHKGESVHASKGEKMCVYARVEAGVIQKISFEGEGSAIALASASLMCQRLMGASVQDAQSSIEGMRAMFSADVEDVVDFDYWGDLAALSGVRQFPARVDCALLAWEALESALKQEV